MNRVSKEINNKYTLELLVEKFNETIYTDLIRRFTYNQLITLKYLFDNKLFRCYKEYDYIMLNQCIRKLKLINGYKPVQNVKHINNLHIAINSNIRFIDKYRIDKNDKLFELSFLMFDTLKNRLYN